MQQVEIAVYAHRTEECLEQQFGYTPKLGRRESASSEGSPDWVSVVEMDPTPQPQAQRVWETFLGGLSLSADSVGRKHLQPEVCSPTETAPTGFTWPVSLIQMYPIISASLFVWKQQSSLSAQLFVINKPSFWVLQFLHLSTQTTTQLSVPVMGCLSFLKFPYVRSQVEFLEPSKDTAPKWNWKHPTVH